MAVSVVDLDSPSRAFTHENIFFSLTEKYNLDTHPNQTSFTQYGPVLLVFNQFGWNLDCKFTRYRSLDSSETHCPPTRTYVQPPTYVRPPASILKVRYNRHFILNPSVLKGIWLFHLKSIRSYEHPFLYASVLIGTPFLYTFLSYGFSPLVRKLYSY